MKMVCFFISNFSLSFYFQLLAPKVLLEYLWPLITIQSHTSIPSHKAYVRPWIDLNWPPMTSNGLQWPPRTTKDLQGPKTQKKGVGEWGAVSSRSFDLLNSMIYDLKRSIELRWLFDPVLHSLVRWSCFLFIKNRRRGGGFFRRTELPTLVTASPTMEIAAADIFESEKSFFFTTT